MAESTQKLRTALGASGHRVTGPRLAVWEVIASASHHMTADEIAAQVRMSDPTVNRSSVYRSLALFDELGLVRQSNLGSSEVGHWELSDPEVWQSHTVVIDPDRKRPDASVIDFEFSQHLGPEEYRKAVVFESIKLRKGNE